MHFEFEERLLTTFDLCSSLRIVLGSFCAIGNSSEDPIRGLIHSGDCHGREGNQIQVAFSSLFFLRIRQGRFLGSFANSHLSPLSALTYYTI